MQFLSKLLEGVHHQHEKEEEEGMKKEDWEIGNSDMELPGKQQKLFSREFFFFFNLNFGCTTQHVGSLVPHARIKPEPPTEEVQSLNQDHQGSPSKRIFR